MIKTVKGKVIAGVVSVGLVMGTGGVVLGASDAGGKLQEWYDGQFGKSSQEVESEVSTYAEGKVDGLDTYYKGQKDKAENSINNKGEQMTSIASKNINTMSDEHIVAINNKAQDIDNLMSTQFEELRTHAKTIIRNEADILSKKLTTNMFLDTTDIGKLAGNSLESDLKKATDLALADIEGVIDSSKAELQSKLNNKTEATTEDIIKLIDKRVKEIRVTITLATNRFIENQQGHLEDKAQKAEEHAKKEMQDLVDGI